MFEKQLWKSDIVSKDAGHWKTYFNWMEREIAERTKSHKLKKKLIAPV